MESTSTNEVRASLMDANTRCMALETKLGGLSMDHRAAQRKMANELDSRVRAMDTLRSGVEGEVKTLKSKNERLHQILASVCDKMRSHGLEIPVEAVAEMGSEEAQGVPSEDNEEEGGRTGRSKTRNSRSPSPFRRFMGKRAASPSRTTPNATQGEPPVVAPTNAPVDAGVASAASKLKPVSFRRFASNNGQENGTPEGSSSNQRPFEASGTTVPTSTREASPSAAATRSAGTSGASSGVTDSTSSSGGKSNMTDLLQDRRNTSREVAAQKHAARLKAVRTSSRGKWGFSV